jgi:hypothetical protein
MIFYGIILLVIGLVCYGVARGGHAPGVVGTIGWILSAIGAILLVVGLVLLLIPAAGTDLDADSAHMLLRSSVNLLS